MAYDQELHMPPPDWARTLVNSSQKKMPSGDPSLWGNTVTTVIDGDDPAATIPEGPIAGAQVLLAHATDQYTRSWSVTGSLTLPRSVWSTLVTGDPPNGLTDGLRPPLAVYLSVLQGVEKVTIEHLICLMYGGTAANIGLCNNQCTINGGPYLPTIVFGNTGSTNQDQETRPFAAIGALIGNTITARAIYVRANTDELTCNRATISVLLTPYAAGAGI